MSAGLGGAYLHAVPNVQPLDLVVMCSGLVLGLRDGVLIGGLTMLIYSLLNPYGPAPVLVLLAQVIGEAGYGAGGGVLAHLGLGGWRPAPRAAALGLAALLLTPLFDTITNLATGLQFGQMRMWLVGGIPFALLHLATNLGLFVVVGTPLAPVLSRYRERLSS